MHYPVLFKIGSVTIYSYGLFLTLAILSGVFLFWRRARKQGFDGERILDLCLLSLLSGVVGARVAFVLFNFSVFYSDFWDIFRSFNTGLSFSGGLIFGFLGFAFFARRYGWSVLKLSDQLVFPFTFSLTLGNFGLFISGLSSSEALWKIVLFFLATLILFVFEKDFLWGKGSTRPRTGFYSFLGIILFGLTGSVNNFVHWRRGLLFRIEQLMFLLAMTGGIYCLVTKNSKDLEYLWVRVRGFLSSSSSPPPDSSSDNGQSEYSNLDQLRDWLFRESSEIEKEKQQVREGDLFYRAGREDQNAEVGDEGQELLSHHYAETIQEFLTSFGLQIQKALARMHIGEYGKCDRCGEQISAERLKAYPAVTLCIDCAQKKEEKEVLEKVEDFEQRK